MKIHQNTWSVVLFLIGGTRLKLSQKVWKKRSGERNFWRQVLDRVINVTLSLAMSNLSFRRHDEYDESQENRSNFLSLITLLSKYDPVLKRLLSMPHSTVNVRDQLSQIIQFVSVESDESGKAKRLQVNEIFLGFVEVHDQSVAGISGTILKKLKKPSGFRKAAWTWL